jgi:hypothetical protein
MDPGLTRRFPVMNVKNFNRPILVKRCWEGAIAALIALGCLSVVRTASAAGGAKVGCSLSRSPFMIDSSLPASLKCQFDQDGNGLDDVVEREIARCVVPEIAYDPDELFSKTSSGGFRSCTLSDRNADPTQCNTAAVMGATANLVEEPNVVFFSYRSGASEISIHYATMWSADGGFVDDGGFGCDNSHLGDCQNFKVRAFITKNSTSWAAQAILVDDK